jgi:hypothetical protein
LSVEAQVAEVLPPYEVVLNAGKVQGVEVGFVATVWRTVEVKDPVTGSELGSVRRPKLRLEVSEVHETFCVAQSIEFYAGAFDALFSSGPAARQRKRVAKASPGAVRDPGEEASVAIGDAATLQAPPKPKTS